MDQAQLAIVIAGIVQALKTAGLPSQYAPLAAAGVGLLAGIVGGLGAGDSGSQLISDAITGLAEGLGASGLVYVAGKIGAGRAAVAIPVATKPKPRTRGLTAPTAGVLTATRKPAVKGKGTV